MPYDRFLGCTPKLNAYRGQEISNWLMSNKFFKYEDLHRCVILDDLEEAGFGVCKKCKLFRTNPDIGITDSIVLKATKFLLEE